MADNIFKKDTIKVSIVIPIYNVAPYIADCLRSVYEQTYPCLEVILVNDATPDDSVGQAAPWIQKMQERGYEVHIVTHSVNKGLSAARNTGIRAATTEWIYFLDSDDELTPQCIEWMVEQVKQHPMVDFVIGGIKVIGSNWKYPLTCRPYVDSNKEILQDYVHGRWYVMAWNHLYRKEYLLQNNLFFKEGIYHEDELYSFQIAITAQSMSAVHEETYVYKVRSSGSIMAQRKLKNFEDLLSINAERYGYILQKYQEGDFSVPFTYCLDVAYGYVLKLVENRKMSLRVKLDLLKQYKKILQSLIPFLNKKEMSYKYLLLLKLQMLPSFLEYQIVYIYNKL